MMMSLNPFTSALEWACAIRSREVKPSEVLEVYLSRVDRFEERLNTYVLRMDDEARTTALAMDDVIVKDDHNLPQFFGVPMPIKGLNDVRGWPNRYCSLGVPEVPCADDDAYVARFRKAGFVFTGLTTSPEFGSVSVTESAMCGPTRNPWNLDRSPGGSTGGGAATVAVGAAPIAYGSDGGGSIRTPASFTGLVGIKPSRGRVSNEQTQWPGFSAEGTVCRTVADVAATLDIQSVVDERRWYICPPPSAPFLQALDTDPKQMRIGVVRRPGFPVEADADSLAAVDEAARMLEGLGHVVEEVELGYDQLLFERLFITTWVASHGSLPGVDLTRVEPLAREMHRRAQELPPETIWNVINEMQQLTAKCVQPWVTGTVDIVITPTTPSGPPPIGWLFEEAESDPMSVLRKAYHHAGFTALFNMFGLPAVSLPLHMRRDGLPQGVQFVGGPRADWELLQLAAQVERAVPWRARVPQLALEGIVDSGDIR